MAEIEWLDSPRGKGETWNPVTGCTKIAPGCEHCWARRTAETRLRGRHGYPADDPFRPGLFHKGRLDQPRKWRKPRTVGVCLMGDLPHEAVSDEAINEVFAHATCESRHRFLFLTKRPARMAAMVGEFMEDSQGLGLSNAAFGVSVSTQEDVDALLGAAQHLPRLFVSVEPLLEAVDLRPWLKDITWVIVGGESGPRARGCNIQLIKRVIEQAREASVPLFFKQAGAFPSGYSPFEIRDPKGANPMEWPPEMRIRQFPAWLRR